MKKTNILSICLAILFFILALLVFSNHTVGFDKCIYNTWMKLYSNTATTVMKIMTTLGSAKFLIPFALLSFLYPNKKVGASISANLTLSFLSNEILKRVFRRPRPNILWLVEEKGFSFPSGHAMVSTAFYGYLIYLLWKSNLSQKKKILGTILLSLLIFIIGNSRIYLGVHYATDIMAGFLVGGIYLSLYIKCTKNKIML